MKFLYFSIASLSLTSARPARVQYLEIGHAASTLRELDLPHKPAKEIQVLTDDKFVALLQSEHQKQGELFPEAKARASTPLRVKEDGSDDWMGMFEVEGRIASRVERHIFLATQFMELGHRYYQPDAKGPSYLSAAQTLKDLDHKRDSNGNIQFWRRDSNDDAKFGQPAISYDHSLWAARVYNLPEGQVYTSRMILTEAFAVGQQKGKPVVILAANNTNMTTSDDEIKDFQIQLPSPGTRETIIVNSTLQGLQGYTLADITTTPILSKRSVESVNGLDSKQSSQAMTSSQNKCLSAYYTLQAQAQSLLLPVLSRILATTNSQLAYSAAWSVYAELTGSSQFVASPFMGGMNCNVALEKHVLNTTVSRADAVKAMAAKKDLTRDELARLKFYAVNEVLEDLYALMWKEGVKAVNETGLLVDMAILRVGFLMNGTGSEEEIVVSKILERVRPDEGQLEYFTAWKDKEVGGNTLVT